MKKQLVHDIVETFADDIDLSELADKLQVVQEIQLGEKDIDEGRFLTNEEAKKRLARWRTGHQYPKRDA